VFRDELAHVVGIDVQVALADICEDRRGAAVDDHVRGCRPGDRGRDHLVARADTNAEQCEVERSSPRTRRRARASPPDTRPSGARARAARGPVVSQPERIVSATAATPRHPTAGGWNERNVARRASAVTLRHLDEGSAVGRHKPDALGRSVSERERFGSGLGDDEDRTGSVVGAPQRAHDRARPAVDPGRERRPRGAPAPQPDSIVLAAPPGTASRPRRRAR